MRREFEERMDKMKGEVQKIQEEKVHLMGLEQRLRQEFQTQVQAEQMSNEELRIRSLFLLLIYSCRRLSQKNNLTINNLVCYSLGQASRCYSHGRHVVQVCVWGGRQQTLQHESEFVLARCC